MRYKVISPYTPEDAVKMILNALRQINAKVESVTSKSLMAKIKTGFMTSVPIQVSFRETPYGSIIEFAIPTLLEDQLVDETFFGERVAYIGQREKVEKVKIKIGELKACIDGLDEEEARNIFDLHTRVTLLNECPHCGSNVRKGFRCAYCNSLMIKFG